MTVAPTMSPHAHADAARLLYRRYYPNVYRYALSQLHAAEDAEDAAQNTFLRAFAALQKGTVPENELAWLFKIAHNVCATSKLAWLRRRRVETPRDLNALRIEPSSPETQHDELEGLAHALAAMPQRPREAFLLREVQGLSYAEIAEQLGTTRSAVETLIFRARKMLAEKLEQPMRRARQALGLGPLLSFARGIFDSAPAAVKAAGAIAVVAGTSVAAAPHSTSSRPAPATPARIVIASAPVSAPARVSRPGPHRAAHRRTAAPAAPHHSVAVPLADLPPAPGPPRSAPATPSPIQAPEAAAATHPIRTPTTSPATATLTLPAPPALPVDVPTLPVTIPPVPAVPLPEIPEGPAVVSVTVPATLPGLPPVPPVTVSISVP